MVISCSALGCCRRQTSMANDGNKVSFHRFPRNKEICQAWLVASRREDFVPTKFSYLCSDHFADDQFSQPKNTKRARLKSNAVPTLFKGFPSLRKTPTKPNTPNKAVQLALGKHLRQKINQPPNTEETTPQPIFENPNLKKIAPKPQNTMQPQILVAPTSSNIFSVLNALPQTHGSSKQNSNNVSIFVVHPQPNGSSIVMPSTFGSIPNANLGGIASSNLSCNSIFNLGSLSNGNFTTVPANNYGTVNSKTEVLSDYSDGCSSGGDPDLMTDEKRKLKLKDYEERIKSYQKECKLLHQRNRRQQRKILMLQQTIKDLKNPCCSEDENFSEDISEEEIFEELMKQQTQSNSEEIEDCSL